MSLSQASTGTKDVIALCVVTHGLPWLFPFSAMLSFYMFAVSYRFSFQVFVFWNSFSNHLHLARVWFWIAVCTLVFSNWNSAYILFPFPFVSLGLQTHRIEILEMYACSYRANHFISKVIKMTKKYSTTTLTQWTKLPLSLSPRTSIIKLGNFWSLSRQMLWVPNNNTDHTPLVIPFHK